MKLILFINVCLGSTNLQDSNEVYELNTITSENRVLRKFDFESNENNSKETDNIRINPNLQPNQPRRDLFYIIQSTSTQNLVCAYLIAAFLVGSSCLMCYLGYNYEIDNLLLAGIVLVSLFSVFSFFFIIYLCYKLNFGDHV